MDTITVGVGATAQLEGWSPVQGPDHSSAKGRERRSLSDQSLALWGAGLVLCQSPRLSCSPLLQLQFDLTSAEPCLLGVGHRAQPRELGLGRQDSR